MPKPSPLERELQLLAAQFRKVEAEYTMFFSGRSGRPPVESRAALDRAFKRYDRVHFDTALVRFQFSTLQARYATFCDLWDRGVRAREEGRSGPFMRQLPDTPSVAEPAEIVHAASFRDPAQELDALRDLYDALMEARRASGDAPVPFHRFAGMVRDQVRTLRERHPSDDVWVQVTRQDGKVALVARAVRQSGDGEPDA